MLYGAGNNTDIDFARSSSAISATEAGAGLQAFPFALDTLAMAVSNTTPSHAPASLTGAQIVDIYKGNITNWSELGGSPGVIAPKTPQPGSGTRSFWDAQLKAAQRRHRGHARRQRGRGAGARRHAEIKNNPNAVAPFSVGRAGLLGTTLSLRDGLAGRPGALQRRPRHRPRRRQGPGGLRRGRCALLDRRPPPDRGGRLPAPRHPGPRRRLWPGHPGRDEHVHAQRAGGHDHEPRRSRARPAARPRWSPPSPAAPLPTAPSPCTTARRRW